MLYDHLTDEELLNLTNVTLMTRRNIFLLNNTIADWVMTSRASLEFAKNLSSDGNNFH